MLIEDGMIWYPKDYMVITDEMKEFVTIAVMRDMLEMYSNEHGIEFEDALLSFVKSITYDAIFDFETGIWREGASYFLGLYEEELSGREV